jgi:hypothetical protein
MAREAARATQCRNNLKQLGLAQHNAHDVLERLLPGADMNVTNLPLRDYAPAWGLLIMPYMEMTASYDSFDPNVPCVMCAGTGTAGTANAGNKDLAELVIPNYLCPSASDIPYTLTTSGALKNLANVKFSRTWMEFYANGAWHKGGRTHYAAIHGAVENYADRTTNYWSILEKSYPGGTGVTAHGAGCTESTAPNGAMPAIQRKGNPAMYLTLNQIVDGTTNTMLFTEDSSAFLSHWGQHYNLIFLKEDYFQKINEKPFAPFPKVATATNVFGTSGMYTFHSINSFHVGGVNSVFVDGRVSFISENTEKKIIRLAFNRKDGEMVVLP